MHGWRDWLTGLSGAFGPRMAMAVQRDPADSQPGAVLAKFGARCPVIVQADLLAKHPMLRRSWNACFK